MIEKIEQDLRDKGYRYVVGIDEVGRGPLCGDVVSSAVCMDLEKPIEGIKDSKKLSEKKRLELAKIIKEKSIAYTISGAPPELIDKINIKKATIKTMEKALEDLLLKLEKLSIKPDIVLVDAEKIQTNLEVLSLAKGDDLSMSIGAASILAKVYRDSQCSLWDDQYPGYDLKNNKGYGTSAHRKALVRLGPSPIHRKTFLKNMDSWAKNPYILGSIGEDLAGEYFENLGYDIIDRNYKHHVGEIDLICKKDMVINFVEVKLRKNTDYGYGHEYVSSKQKKRILDAAKTYIVKEDLEGYQFRFDIVEYYTDTDQLVVYEDAFN